MTQEISALAAAVEAKAIQRARELATDVVRSVARLIVLGAAAGCLVAAGIGALLMVVLR